MPSVRDISIDHLPQVRDLRGLLGVVEFGEWLPFDVIRLFYVLDVPPGTVRGNHAHRRCSQYVICQSGRVRIDLSDGDEVLQFELIPGQAVLIEPGIFASETYLDVGSVIIVLCDRPYEKDDYIHTLEEFLATVRADR